MLRESLLWCLWLCFLPPVLVCKVWAWLTLKAVNLFDDIILTRLSFYLHPERHPDKNMFLHTATNFGPLPSEFVNFQLPYITAPQSRDSPYLQAEADVRADETLKAYTLAPTSGHLPHDLRGQFVRNGPNPRNTPTKLYHWFDGDGMLACVHMVGDGQLRFFTKLIPTPRLAAEEQTGRQFMKLGELTGRLGLISILLWTLRRFLGFFPLLPVSPGQGPAPTVAATTDFELRTGTANTAVVFHNKRLFALVESNYPFELRVLADGVLQPRGHYTFSRTLTHTMTAHPKVDPVTGEMVFFGYQIRDKSRPWVQCNVVARDGTLGPDFAPGVSLPTMMHDFAITEHYTVLMELPLVFEPERMFRGLDAFTFSPSLGSRFAIFPRHATSPDQVRWFAGPPCYVFHTANAYEDGDEVVLQACRYSFINLDLSSFMDSNMSQLHEWRFNMSTGKMSERPLGSENRPNVEFPTINNNYLGRRARYCYCAEFPQVDAASMIARSTGVVKVDLASGETVGRAVWGAGRVGGEAVFVPRDPPSAEDAGYLITFVFDDAAQTSDFVVVDAQSMATVCTVRLPHRVPFGFHGTFIPGSEL